MTSFAINTQSNKFLPTKQTDLVLSMTFGINFFILFANTLEIIMYTAPDNEIDLYFFKC